MEIRETRETTIYPLGSDKDFGFIDIDYVSDNISIVNCDIETIEQARCVSEALQKAISLYDEYQENK